MNEHEKTVVNLRIETIDNRDATIALPVNPDPEKYEYYQYYLACSLMHCWAEKQNGGEQHD